MVTEEERTEGMRKRGMAWAVLICASAITATVTEGASPKAKSRVGVVASTTAERTTSDPFRQDGQESAPFDLYDDEAAAAYYVHHAGVEGTLANFVTYGAFDLLTQAQGLFARNKVTEAVDTLRLISDMTEINRDGIQYLSSLRGELGADVDMIASRAHMLLFGSYLEGNVEIDGSAMSVRTLLHDPEGARALRAYRLKSVLDLDPRFVDEYLSDDMAPKKREAIARVLSVVLPFMSRRRGGYVARHYVTAFMNLWDDKYDVHRGELVRGMGSVFGSDTAGFISVLLKADQHKAVGIEVLRAIIAIYGHNMRGKSGEYRRAYRAANDFLSFKDVVLRNDEGREERFAAIALRLVNLSGKDEVLDLRQPRIRDGFREVFSKYEKVKICDIDIARIFCCSVGGRKVQEKHMFTLERQKEESRRSLPHGSVAPSDSVASPTPQTTPPAYLLPPQ